MLIDNATGFVWGWTGDDPEFDAAAYPDEEPATVARAARDFVGEGAGALAWEADMPEEGVPGYRVYVAPPGWDYDPRGFADEYANAGLVVLECRFVGCLRLRAG